MEDIKRLVDNYDNVPYTVHVEGVGMAKEIGSPNIERLVRLLLKYDEITG
ncbi:hypothetical protein [Aquibacillus kalidii]|nr:hypothetical protein [Aquibacillus kalidii]